MSTREMRSLRAAAPSLTRLLLSAILLGSPAAAWVNQAPDPKPPARLSQVEKGEGIITSAPLAAPIQTATEVSGRIAYSLNNKTVTFKWAWQANGPRPNQFSEQIEPVTYWPTEAVGAGPGRALVAGRRRNGNTVIELWNLGKAPKLFGHEDPPGTWTYPEMVVPIESRVSLLDENTAGRTMTSTMFWIPVPAADSTVSLYVLFDDSRDLCRLDYSNAGVSTIQRLYSMSSGAGVQQIGALSCQHKSRWSGDHNQLGFVYVLTNSMHFEPECQTVLLLDRNRDGAIDSDGVLTPSSAECGAIGLDRADLFTKFF